jgi:hypothetical protein
MIQGELKLFRELQLERQTVLLPVLFAKPLPVTISITGAIVGPEGGTVIGIDGTSVTLQEGAIDYEVKMDVTLVPLSTVVAPTGNLSTVSALEIIFEPTVFNAEFAPPRTPIEISIPAPPNISAGTNLIIAQQILTDFIGGPEVGLREQLVPVDMASVVGERIITQVGIFPGILGGGLFVVVQATGSGFATGIVSDATGPRPGITVSNNTNTLVSVTDAAGRYNLFISGGPFIVTGFDPFRGSSGSVSSNITVPDSTVIANILMSPLAAPPVTRDGIRNSGFERGDLSSWACSGSCSTSQQLGPTSTGVVIRPTEGQWMADINTGTGAVGDVGSSLKQSFIVPVGVQTLRFDFNFVSEEFPEFVGTIFDDAFKAIITIPNGEVTFAQVSVNQSGGFELIGDCFFPGGDETCGQTGWREGSVDLSAFAGTNTPITVELLLSALDAGDNIYDTHVLMDNIRFGTVWVDAKIIDGANANQARIQAEILRANDILSQAGLIIRLRNAQTIADPGGLLDIDTTWTTGPACADGRINGRLTAEETQLLGLARSAKATDMNVYYTRELINTGFLNRPFFALAIGPDDFCVDVNILTNSGIVMSDISSDETLAHELGHILISPDTIALEHDVMDATNIMRVPRSVPRTVVSRQQSANINQVGAPLIVP